MLCEKVARGIECSKMKHLFTNKEWCCAFTLYYIKQQMQAQVLWIICPAPVLIFDEIS
jgi:hypothetical protein